MALKRPKRMRIRLDGHLAAHVGAKDVALRIIAELGVAGARGHVVEYAGSAVGVMSIEARMTLCNLNIEMGGRSGLIAPDEQTLSWLAGRPYAPQGALWERALARWRTLESDEGASFDREHMLDATALEPQISWGTDPSQVVGISGRVPDPTKADYGRRAAMENALAYMGLEPGMPLAGLPVERVFIGSCTNSRLPDLQAAAEVVRGRHVAEGVIAMVVPGSTSVKRDAEAAGLDRCSAMPDFSGASPAVPCARAETAIAGHRVSAASPLPTAISSTAKGPKCAPISQARRLPPPLRWRDASPTCGRSRLDRSDAAVHQPYRHRRSASRG
jgi:3-isopropylmalate/(R)-2-methylmalate dehydratase large subunit